MSGELALLEEPAGVVDLIAKAREMEAAWTIADRLAQTSFVPKSYGGKVAETAAAIVAGSELGLGVMASLQSIDVIDGRPSVRALAMRALALRAGHVLWVEESSSQRAIVRGHRAGSREHIETVTWDMAKAVKAGLDKKTNWVKYPEQMLVARATADLIRLIAPEVVLGLPYSAEEVGDGFLDEPAEEEAKPRRSSTARRKPLPEKAPAEEPPLEGETSVLPDVDDPEGLEIPESSTEAEPVGVVAGGEVSWNVAPIPVAEVAPLDLEEPPVDWGDDRG